MSLLLRIFVLLICCLGLSGCGLFGKRVAAFERQTLSVKGMQFISNPVEESSMQHMFNAREGSVGGFGGAGGGCGCN
jgi:hypothetical protein